MLNPVSRTARSKSNALPSQEEWGTVKVHRISSSGAPWHNTIRPKLKVPVRGGGMVVGINKNISLILHRGSPILLDTTQSDEKRAITPNISETMKRIRHKRTFLFIDILFQNFSCFWKCV